MRKHILYLVVALSLLARKKDLSSAGETYSLGDVVAARKRVFCFLYLERTKNHSGAHREADIGHLGGPDLIIEALRLAGAHREADMSHLGYPDLIAAALHFGVELGYIDKMYGDYYRLTAQGVLYVEEQGTVCGS